MDQVDLDDCAVRLEGGRILHLIWNHGTRIEAGNARAAMDAINTVANGRKYPLLVEMAEATFLSHEARTVFAQPCAASRIALLGAGPVDQVLADYQLRTAPVPCSTRFFTSRADALAWLRQPEETTGTALPTFPETRRRGHPGRGQAESHSDRLRGSTHPL